MTKADRIKEALTAKSSTISKQSFDSLVDNKLLDSKTSGATITEAFRAFLDMAKALRSSPTKTIRPNKQP